MTSPNWTVQRAASRFLTRAPGRATRHAFSFGAHYDPGNVGFGPLLVCNDDRVGTGCGYQPHPHRGADILTWVVSGSLRHTDSSGRTGVVYPGLAQRMSAGTGIVHTEVNDAFSTEPQHRVVPARFVQMWVRPDEPGGSPSYEQREVDLRDLAGDWVPIASGAHGDAAVRIGTAGATLWASRVPTGVRRVLPESELVFVQVVDGTAHLDGLGRVCAGDTVRIRGRAELALTGVHRVEVLVWTFSEASTGAGTAALREAGARP